MNEAVRSAHAGQAFRLPRWARLLRQDYRRYRAAGESALATVFYFPRFGGIILSHGPIGENCTLEQSVTIGGAGKGEAWGMPVIGNRVFIGAHSIIVDKITIGDDAMICPGSLVTRSVPPRAVVMGNPAKVVSYEGSFESIVYDGMEDDPARRSALERSGPPGHERGRP